MIQVTFTKVLDDLWGADEAYEDGGPQAVIELLGEDLVSFITDNSGTWTVTRLQ